ncbi:hypothetical protein BABA_25386 [Neobacillus bataviensis LMG 21833]|uniref:Uncharacterized protein n=1 Tax=Neobacillus bataviensis LMG 21833 TaxID=1117379 RepID=K6D3D5_9BACI|nr:hypothetical protein BABA_25386 [Neobacillus bataviensis LMG 21833]
MDNLITELRKIEKMFKAMHIYAKAIYHLTR